MASTSIWLVDLDGVIWLGDEVIEGSPAAVHRLRANGRRVSFFTNNSFVSRGELLSKLARFGIETEPEDLLTSGEAAAALCTAGERVFVLGGAGATEALAARGVTLVDADEASRSRIDAVVVGLDRTLDFARLSAATRAIGAGARFIATNDDATYPVPDGVVPGAGALVAAVATATGVTPTVAGKPNPGAAELVRQRLGAVDVVVGDRLSTDGLLAKRLGAPFGLVHSGITKQGAPHADLEIAWEARDFASLVAFVLGEQGRGDGGEMAR